MTPDDELRRALAAFDEAGRALVEALRHDPSGVPALLAAAEARLAEARAVLERLRKRETPP